jgi:hypothetical protein
MVRASMVSLFFFPAVMAFTSVSRSILPASTSFSTPTAVTGFDIDAAPNIVRVVALSPPREVTP